MVQEVCEQEQSCTSEPALDARDTGVAEPDPLEVPPPSQECPGLVMTSSTAPQPSAVQALDSMKALTILTGLLALHDGRACSLKEEGYQKASDPLDEERMEGPDPRDPRTRGAPCYGKHKVAKAYKGSVSGANQFASWTGCEVCKLRLSYTPRMGCHGIHRKSAPLAKDVTDALRDLPSDTESYPSNREISLSAAENSALARLEHLRRLRKGSGKTTKDREDHSKIPDQSNKTTAEDQSKIPDQSSKTTVEDQSKILDQSSKTTKKDQSKIPDQSSKTTAEDLEKPKSQASATSSPLSPGVVLVDPEELPRHASRKASRMSTTLTEDLEDTL